MAKTYLAKKDHTHTAADVGAAAASHTHAASDIASGTLSSDRLPTVPIAKGGTGATTAAAALTNLGITATAAELNKLDGVTATATELNYVDGVTSNIQTQLDGKSPTSHTHDNPSLGHAYCICSTAAATVAKTVSLTGFTLKNGGIVVVKFTYDVPDNATLNISGTGAKQIIYRSDPIVSGIIKGGDTATFAYDGSYYELLSVDRDFYTDVLPISKGGTGATTASAALTALGAAASSHNHAASNITSGTLAVARGGTGVTSNPSMLVNLASTSAASVFAASPRPGVTGTLPIANGGTGATTAEAARTALGVAAASHTHDYLPLSGGTLTGDCTVTNGKALFLRTTNSTYTTYMQAATGRVNIVTYAGTDSNNRRALEFQDKTRADLDAALILTNYVDGTGTQYKIHGAHNKPSGTYSGNGGSQTIDTGGIGDVILVQLTGSGGGMALVSKSGAILKTNSNNLVEAVSDTDAQFIDGVLTLNTSEYALNRSGYGYNWQVL